MSRSRLKALSKLKEAGSKGVTWDDFPRGYAIRSRVSELRLQYEIRTTMEEVSKGVKRARYFLIGKLKNI